MIGGCGGETRWGSSPPFGTIADEVKSAVEVSTVCKPRANNGHFRGEKGVS